MIDINNTNWSNTTVSILGAGESGLSAAKLAKHIGADVFLSDSSTNKINLKEIQIETGEHSKKVLESDFIIKSPGIPNDINIIKDAIDNNIPIISEIEFSSWFTQSPIIGVTGSNGKSTTVNLIHQVFKNSGYNSMLGGNIGIPFSKNVYEELISKKSNGIHILELSSFQLEHIFHLSLEVACLLNISEDHLDRYNDFNDYVNTKLKILKTIKSDGHVVYNNEDNLLNNKLNSRKDSISYSIQDIKSIDLDFSSIHLKGIHNYSNIAAALAIFKIYKIDPKIIIQSIKNFKSLPHRLEYVTSLNGTLVYNDSKATNLNSMIVAIDSFDQKIIIIVGGLDKGESDFYNILKKYNKKLSFIACYGESGKKIHNDIKNELNSSYNKLFSNAVLDAISNSTGKEVLLLSPACASYDQFSSYIERGNKFKEIIIGLS